MPFPYQHGQSLPERFINIRGAIPPYVPFGAGSRNRSEQLLRESVLRHRKKGEKWNFDQFSDDELRSIVSDPKFATNLLKEYDPSFKTKKPTTDDVRGFMRSAAQEINTLRLFPGATGNIPGIGKPYGLTAEQAERNREAFQERVSADQKKVQQSEAILKRAARIAPLSDLHTTAKDMLLQHQRLPEESIRLGKEEIDAARRTNIAREISPYLERASQTPDAYIRRYMESYNPLIQNFREEARKDFLENDIPAINNQFASHGAFYSSAREAALRKAIADKDARITREIRNLTAQAHEHGMRDFNAERAHHIKQAEVVGHAHGAQREANIRAAEALRINALSGQQSAIQQAAALSNAGSIEQRQRQHEIDVAMQEHEREQERPWLEVAREASLLGQMPPVAFPPQELSHANINPAPPNSLAALGGALAQMSGFAMQPQFQQQSYSTGGHVRNKYADGDSVARAASQFSRMKEHTENSPEEAEMRQRAQSYKNYRANPMGDYLFALGTHQLGNLQEDPLKTFAQGSALGMQASKSAHEHNLSLQEKENNLIDKVNQTKMYMQDFLSRHHSTMLQHEEMMRHHKAQESESKRIHDYAMDSKNDKIQEIKKSSADRKLELDAIKNIKDSQALTNDLSKMNKLLSNKRTGKFIGAAKETLGIDDSISKLGNDIVVKAQQSLSNIRGSQYLMELLKSTKPGITSSKEANDLLINSLKNGANDARDKAIIELLDMGWTPEKINKKLKVEVPSYLLDEDVEGVIDHDQKNDFQIEYPDMVEMIAPDGTRGMIPKENISAALEAGGQLSQ